MENLSGIWEGEYSLNYGTESEPDVEYYGFRFEIVEKGGIFNGVWTDLDQDLGNSSINGFIEDDFISFIQKYEQPVLEDESRNYFNEFRKPFPEIHYSGNFNSDDKSYMGFWEMVVGEQIMETSGNYMEEIRTGAWYIRKT